MAFARFDVQRVGCRGKTEQRSGAMPTFCRISRLCLTTIAALVLTCSEKGTPPGAEANRLIALLRLPAPGQPARIAIVDTDVDSVVAEFGLAGQDVGRLAVSGDGSRAALSQEGGFYVWDLNAHDLIWNRPSAFDPQFLPGGRLLVNTPDSIVVYDRSFAQTIARPGRIRFPQRFGRDDLVIGVEPRPSTEGGYENSKLTIVNTTTLREVDSIIVDPDSAGVGLHIFRFIVSKDGSRLYALGYSGRADGEIGTNRDVLIGYDIRTRRVLFVVGVDTAWGFCRLSPDETELWYTDAAEIRYPLWRKFVFILDACTGAALDSVSTVGFYPDTIPFSSNRALEPQEIRFERTGERVYVLCGALSFGSMQPIMVIDRDSREVLRLLFDSFLDKVFAIETSPGCD